MFFIVVEVLFEEPGYSAGEESGNFNVCVLLNTSLEKTIFITVLTQPDSAQGDLLHFILGLPVYALLSTFDIKIFFLYQTLQTITQWI